jgi:membrane-bound lytic murein transglycosylase D
MLKLIWPFLLSLLLWGNTLSAQTIPQPLVYCGLRIDLSSDARYKLTELVRQIQSSPRYFNQMVQRAHCYMPFVEEALKESGVPEDLKFLAIQESSLMPSAVSTSNAVGFWQFKAPTAQEMGLMVDERVDERRHIFRASLAAGRYLAKVNDDFDNWAYAVIAYNQGPTGAIPFTDPAFYSVDQMYLDGESHIYLMKAIAHKIAYEEALAGPSQADYYLVPHSTIGETNLDNLADEHDMSVATLLEHNPWILNERRLPQTERPFTYYVPVSAHNYLGHREDPTKGIIMQASAPIAQTPIEVVDLTQEATPQEQTSTPTTAPTPAPTKPRPSPALAQGNPRPVALSAPSQSLMPRATNPAQLARQTYAVFPIRADLEYGVEYAMAENDRALFNLALRYDIALTKLMAWNGFSAGEEPTEGQVIYLKNPKKSRYHVVLPGETLADIALQHDSKVRRIQRKNRMDKEEYTIYIGQKLYLRGKKPKGEKLIVLVEQWTPNESYTPLSIGQTDWTESSASIAAATPAPAPRETTPQIEPKPEPIPTAQQPTRPRIVSSAPQPTATPEADERTWITHRVSPGETLWRISQRYGTKVEIIKRSNTMTSDDLSPGQELRILVRNSVLQKDREATTRD